MDSVKLKNLLLLAAVLLVFAGCSGGGGGRVGSSDKEKVRDYVVKNLSDHERLDKFTVIRDTVPSVLSRLFNIMVRSTNDIYNPAISRFARGTEKDWQDYSEKMHSEVNRFFADINSNSPSQEYLIAMCDITSRDGDEVGKSKLIATFDPVNLEVCDQWIAGEDPEFNAIMYVATINDRLKEYATGEISRDDLAGMSDNPVLRFLILKDS